ncbi:MAG: TaqI-like C-terminal specificity domain-containing protein, partial [Candidatus Paceibacterota bacterium]
LEAQGYKTFSKRSDLYALFVEKGFDILKPKGITSFIMPNKWLQAGYGKPLREFFLTKRLIRLIDFGDLQIFDGATTYPCIFIARNDNPSVEFEVSVLLNDKTMDFYLNVETNFETFSTKEFDGNTWVISSKRENELLARLNDHFGSLYNLVDGNANYGIKFGLTEAFLIDDLTKIDLITKDPSSEEVIGSILRGRNLTRYGTPNKSDLDNLILASYGSYKYLPEKYTAIYEYLLQFEKKLKKRGQCSGSKPTPDKPFPGQHHWLELDNNPTQEYLDLYSKPKIMYQSFQVKPCFIFDEQGLYCNNSMWIIPTEDIGLLGILNSKMGWWLITKYCTQIQNGYQLIWKYFGQIPVPVLNGELDSSVEKIISINNDLDKITSSFLKLLQSKFDIEKLSRKLESWHKLTFKQFLAELKKKKVTLSLKEEA